MYHLVSEFLGLGQPHLGRMMRTYLSWIQPYPLGVILRHLLNTVNSFLRASTNYFENQLLPNDLIIVRNLGDDEEDSRHQESAGGARRCTHQSRDPIQFKIPEFDFESNSESRTTSASN
jgi:hypothetical protein